MGKSSLVMGMQLDIAAIKGSFPEGVWLSGLFWFLLERRYLTVVFQGDDGTISVSVQVKDNRSRSSVAAKSGLRIADYEVTGYVKSRDRRSAVRNQLLDLINRQLASTKARQDQNRSASR